MSPPHNFGEYAERRALFIQELIVRQVKGDALRAAIVLVEHSYGLAMDAARFASQNELAEILGMTKGNCSRAIHELTEREMLRTYPYAGSQWYEPRPVTGWQANDDKREVQPDMQRAARSAWKTAEQRASRSAWKTAEQRASRDPRQGELIAWTPTQQGDGGLSAALAEAQKESPQKVISPITSEPDTPPVASRSYQPDNSERGAKVISPITLQPPLRTRARHDHAYEETTSLMTHDHEPDDRKAAEGESGPRPPVRWRRELRELELELFERLETAMQDHGEAMTTSYEQLWCGRITTNPGAAYDAIGDTARTLREGRVKKTVGGLANRLWKDFSGAQPFRPQTKAKA